MGSRLRGNDKLSKYFIKKCHDQQKNIINEIGNNYFNASIRLRHLPPEEEGLAKH